MKDLSPKGRRASAASIAFVSTICDLSNRGDIEGITESLKGYWKDKRSHPWHRIHRIIDSSFDKEKQKESMLLIRDAVFGALDCLSMSLPLEISSEEILKILCKGKNWRQGKRKVRNECAERVEELLTKSKTDFLVESALKRDGFGYLVSQLHKARLSLFKKGRPKAARGTISLKKLRRSSIGRRLLKELKIDEKELDEEDSRATQLIEMYGNLLLELELDIESHLTRVETEQITLNGQPIDGGIKVKQTDKSRSESSGVQANLTDYMGAEKKSSKRKARERAKRKREKKRRAKEGSKK